MRCGRVPLRDWKFRGLASAETAGSGMKAIWKSASFVLAVCVLAATPAAVSQQSATPSSTYRSCPTSNAAVAASVHAAPQSMPYLNLCDGHMLGNGASVASAAKPLSLASGDFDEDGTPDLVSGFASGKGGSITVHRGNVRALWAYGADLRNGPPPAFFPEARTFSLPEAPDFIVTGRFRCGRALGYRDRPSWQQFAIPAQGRWAWIVPRGEAGCA